MSPNDLFDEANLAPGPNEFDPAASLDELLLQSDANPAYRPEFFRRLLLAQLYILVEEEIDYEREEDGYVPMRPIFAGEGTLPVFTSLAQLQAKPADWDYPHVDIKGRELFASLPETDVLLNPFGERGMRLRAPLLQRLVAGEGPLKKEAANSEEGEVNMTIALPEKYPPGLLDALQTVCSGLPRVRTAYLLYLLEASDRGPRIAIYLDVEGDIDRIAQEVGQVAQSFAQPGQRVEVAPAIPDISSVIDYALNTPPIYVRE